LKNIVVLTGAGISAESGLKTFRDSDGLWEGYDLNEVATPEGWRRDPHKVQDFYNMRRKSVLEAEPNVAHFALAGLDHYANVQVITQNIDNLHERAGSKNILHLHGIITKSQSSLDRDLVYDIEGWELKMGEKCERGSQLRPHVVWFGEDVPMMEKALLITMKADVLIVIGTSMQVYPAVSLVHYVPEGAPVYVVDPNATQYVHRNWNIIPEKAGTGVEKVIKELMMII
jgi:NAD-dependent deacetylase